MKNLTLIVVLAVMLTGGASTSTSTAKIVPQMYASLRYDYFTDAILWIAKKIAPFKYLSDWSGRTP